MPQQVTRLLVVFITLGSALILGRHFLTPDHLRGTGPLQGLSHRSGGRPREEIRRSPGVRTLPLGGGAASDQIPSLRLVLRGLPWACGWARGLPHGNQTGHTEWAGHLHSLSRVQSLAAHRVPPDQSRGPQPPGCLCRLPFSPRPGAAGRTRRVQRLPWTNRSTEERVPPCESPVHDLP